MTIDEVARIAKRLDGLDGIAVVLLDSVIPSAVFKVANVAALELLLRDPNVDYVEARRLQRSELAFHTGGSGCGLDAFSSGPHGTVSEHIGPSSTNLIHWRVRDLGVLRAWGYGLDGSTVSIGWSDTGADVSGSWPVISDLFTTSLIVLNPNDGTDCSHGNRMMAVSSGPGRTAESIGIAPRSTVVSSDAGNTVAHLPHALDPFASLARLNSTLALHPSLGPRLIALGWGTTNSNWLNAINDLIDAMY